jgi:flagellin-like hook-associated protein FlgL
MPLGPISTFAATQSTLSDVSKVIANLQQQQQQVSSGNASSDFAGMDSEVQQYLSLDSILSRTDQYLNNNKIIETRLNTTSTTLSEIIKTATDLQNLISQRRTGVANSAAFGLQVQGVYQQLAGQLNTSVDNNFLFSGSKINAPAIDATKFPKLLGDGIPDKGYYLGNSQYLFASPQENVTVAYNVPGDAMGFQNIIAGLASAKEADATKNDALMKTSYDLVQKGIQDVINLQATVNGNKVLFTNSNTFLSNSKLYYQGIQQTIGNTDLVSVSTQVATNQGILQAAFSVYAKISSLRLSDYLK